MPETDTGLTGYHDKLIDLTRDIVNHGWGEVTIKAASYKDGQTEIRIYAGKTWLFFVKKKFNFDKNKIF